jgi:SAM-dependent methyltransferase
MHASARSADLIAASQAFHWFDHARFFAEVRRVARPGAVLAVWCYGLDVELAAPPFEIRVTWRIEQLIGYLETWSALATYRRVRGDDPMPVIVPKIERAWGAADEREVRWPVGMRAFRVQPGATPQPRWPRSVVRA